jgi:ADP-ribose pyrophosphatase YjhB (NUDIX family)
MVYVNVLPVRLDDVGDVLEVGTLLRISNQGISRALVCGRVLYHERVRDAIKRLVEHDLGPMALPRVPASPQPFTVAEYLPTPGITPFHDPRQHAVALCYVVPVAGDCQPRQDAIQVDWITPEETLRVDVLEAFEGGQSALVKQALAFLGRLT